MERDAALDRVERILETIDSDPMPVPVRELWVYGDVALGLDPIERLDVYLTKDLRLGGDAPSDAREERFGAEGIGRTVSAEWAEQFPQHVRANESGHVAPERCLAAHLLPEDEPVHLEVCNAGFEDNVTQRLQGAVARDAYEEILDPRGVCLWLDGRRAEDALDRLRGGELAFPTLPDALEMLGVEMPTAEEAAEAVRAYRAGQSGATVRGDVV